MSIRVISVRLKEKDIGFLKLLKGYEYKYDSLVNKLINECDNVLAKVDDFSKESLQIFTMKLDEMTLERLDTLARYNNITRSEVIRRLIKAKAEGLC